MTTTIQKITPIEVIAIFDLSTSGKLLPHSNVDVESMKEETAMRVQSISQRVCYNTQSKIHKTVESWKIYIIAKTTMYNTKESK